MVDSADSAGAEWSRDVQKVAVLSWISFLTASASSVLFFAFVDPLLLVEAINIDATDSRYAGYAIGFFFFWTIGWVSGWFSMRLIRRKRRGPAAGQYPGVGTR
jgi:hypothetical protein